jgi:hypothetical protein
MLRWETLHTENGGKFKKAKSFRVNVLMTMGKDKSHRTNSVSIALEKLAAAS